MERIVKIILGLGVVAFFGVAIWAFMQSTVSDNNDKFKNYDANSIIKADKTNGGIGDHVRGNLDSKVVVVEYADYECPGCATAANRMEEVYEKYKDKVAFVFRHYPVHTHATIAAAAAESAGKQGKFWEMSLQLFQNQAEWADENASNSDRVKLFNTYFSAVHPGGSITKFEDGLSDKNIIKKVEFDRKIGDKRSHLTETPSFYINGKKFSLEGIGGDDDFINKMSSAIDEALK